MTATPVILVTDGEQRAALATVRSLGRAGYRVVVTSAVRWPLAGASRYAAEVVRTPDPLTDPEAFTSAVGRITERIGPAVIVPVTDPAVRSLVDARDRLGAVVPFGTAASIEAAADKQRVLNEAAALGIAVPRQRVLSDPGQPAGTAEPWSWPVIVKPARSVSDGPDGAIKLGVSWATDAMQLATTLRRLPRAAYPVLLQERIVGPGTGVFLLRWDDQTRAVFAHERVREKPPDGGVSVCARSIQAPADLVHQAEALLGRLAWRGPAMVEFKRDRATGRHYLMEVNGRLWGSLQLAIDAGVDFPALLVAAALGRPPEPPPQARIGVTVRWWWGEMDHLIARLRGKDRQATLPTGRLGAVRTFLAPGRDVRNEVCRRDDPRPALRETAAWFAAFVGRP